MTTMTETHKQDGHLNLCNKHVLKCEKSSWEYVWFYTDKETIWTEVIKSFRDILIHP